MKRAPGGGDSASGGAGGFFTAAVHDYVAAVQACFADARPGAAAVFVLSMLSSWWVYVPAHELLHAAGCVLAGGEVSRLEIAPIYGARLLGRLFPFVTAGSEYAGRLSGFDTRGSDLTYLATDATPFLLTVLLGVPLLRSAAARTGRAVWRCMRFGAALPVAFAPFISAGGDYYEMGSILVSRVAAAAAPGFPLARWRSDDLIKLAGQLFGAGGDGGATDAAGLATSFLVGAMLMFATYRLGTAWSRVMRRAWTGQRE